jgi:hypothetical protein
MGVMIGVLNTLDWLLNMVGYLLLGGVGLVVLLCAGAALILFCGKQK